MANSDDAEKLKSLEHLTGVSNENEHADVNSHNQSVPILNDVVPEKTKLIVSADDLEY